MTLRNRLGEGVQHLYGQVNELLDSKDALIVFFDGHRLVSYAHGFAASPSQLELLGVEIERAARSAAGGLARDERERRRHEDRNAMGRDAFASRGRRWVAGRVLQLARDIA